MAVIIIVIVILIFFAVASLSLLSVRHQFAEEATYLEILERELRTQTCAPAAFYQIIERSIPNTSVVFERVDIVFRLTSRNVLPNLSEISELAIGSKEVSRANQFVNFVLSALLVSGLGGTFLAFREILAGSDLANAITDGKIDTAKYTAAITKIYDGFNGAFWASICGIFGTVILLFFKFMAVNPVRDRFYNRLDFVTQSELVPKFLELQHKPDQLLFKTATKLDALLAGLQPISQDFNHASTRATGALTKMNTFAATFSGATSRFADFCAPNSPLLVAIDKLFEAVQKYESRYYRYESVLDKLMQEVTNQNARLAETQLTFVQFHTTLESVHKQFLMELEKSNQVHQSAIKELIKTFQTELRSIVERPSSVVDKLLKVSSELNDRQNTYAADFKAATDRLDSAMNKIDASARSLEASVMKTVGTEQNILRSISEVSQRLGNVEGSINAIKISQRDIEAIQHTLKSLDGSMKAIGVSHADIETMLQALRTINRTLETKKFTFSLFGRS